MRVSRYRRGPLRALALVGLAAACGDGRGQGNDSLSGGGSATAIGDDDDDTDDEPMPDVADGPRCGDARIEGDEECDDHSTLCTDCRLPIPELSWAHDLVDDAGPVVIHALAVTPEGDVIVAGSATVLGGFVDSWIRRYSAAGVESWTTIVDLADGSPDEIFAVDVAPSGTILVTGTMEFTTSASGVPMLAQLTADGSASLSWLDQEISDTGPARALDASSAGSVIVTQGMSPRVFRHTGGTELWSYALFDQELDEWWYASDLAFTTGDRVVVVGQRPYGNITLPLVMTLSAAGELEWVVPFEELGEAAAGFGIRHVLVDAGGNAHVVGDTPDGHEHTTWYTRVSATGVADPIVTWSSYPTGIDRLNDVALDPDGAIVLAGALSLGVEAGFVVPMISPGELGALALLCPGDTLCRAPEDGASVGLSIARLAVAPDGGVVVLAAETRDAGAIQWVGKLGPI